VADDQSPSASGDEDASNVNGKEIVVYDADADELDFTHEQINCISNLETAKNLETLGLRQNFIKCVENLGCVSGTLTHLDLYDNQIKVMEGLDSLVHLKHLDLSFNQIRLIKGLESLTGLESLYLVHNKITKLEGLQTLTKLVLLELGDNRLRVIENLDQLTNLEELYLGKNKLSELHSESLSHLSKLRVLSIQCNRLLKLEGFQALTSLEELYASHNGLVCIEGLETCLALKTLDLAGNRIDSLTGMSHLKQLEELWFNDNQVATWSQVDELRSLDSLTTLYLERNPVWRDPRLSQEEAAILHRESPDYRRKIMLTLPQLQQLDATMTKNSVLSRT